MSEVHLKLVDDDYAVLRRFEGRSSLSTYLISVIQRAFFDFQIKRWGRWRPSAMARHLGPLAVELERLVHHEERSLDETCAILEVASGRPVDRQQLSSMLAQLPVRLHRRTVGTERLAEVPAPFGDADTGLVAAERQETARRAEKHLAEALASLAPDDRLIVRLAFVKGLTISAIAKMLGLNRRRLYRVLTRCLGTMRAHLEACGLAASTVAGVLGDPAVRIDVAEMKPADMETRKDGPSHSAGAGPVGADPKRGVP